MDHFGKLLTQGLKSIAALEKSDLTELQHELGKEIGVSVWTIYKWRKGTSIPNDDRTIELLVRACVQRGRMDFQWLSDFLRNTIYSNKQALINDFFSSQITNPVIHNLPRCQHKRLIGRDDELAEIRNFLSPQHRVGVVCISGGGGIGKSALALEIAHLCYEESTSIPSDERFEAIIWVTAKSVELLPAGQVQRKATFTDLDSIYRAIADLLDIPVIFRTVTQAEQSLIITRVLANKRILLMLDNLEDIDDNELLIFLRDLPAPSKAIITTRHRIDVAVPIYLRMLNEATARELIQMECEQHHLMISEEQIKMLIRCTGGLPLAIIRTIGRMAWRGSSIETEIQHLTSSENEIYDFCFAKTIALIQQSDAYRLFMTLAIFATDIDRESLGFVAGFADNVMQRDEGLSDIEVLSLCYKDANCYGLEPLTRTQAQTELRKNPEFEGQARERWVLWCHNLSKHYGGRDWMEMHLQYDHLESAWTNVLAVLHWCRDNDQYEDLLQLWIQLRDFTHIYGYWSDRLNLLNWMIMDADNRQDYATSLELMYDRAFTLTLTGPDTRLEEADALLQRCWSLRQYASPRLQAKITALSASVCIKYGKHEEAHQWLDKGEILLQQSNLEAVELARERTSLLFDRGENCFVMGDYEKAYEVFLEMLAQGEICSWQRSILHAQNWLAYTAILRKMPDVCEAYLWQGWTVASRVKEKRLLAYFKRTFAYYYAEIGKQSESLQWAQDAFDAFERLGMPQDIAGMQDFIQQVSAG